MKDEIEAIKNDQGITDLDPCESLAIRYTSERHTATK